MLKFKHTNFDEAAEILNQVKQGRIIEDNEYQFLIGLINNSIVGVSKLLHFIKPNLYAIFDSRVAKYLNCSCCRLDKYKDYLELCNKLIKDPKFRGVHMAVNKKIGNCVSALRAIELVMYYGDRG
jgi:hypothetical protein